MYILNLLKVSLVLLTVLVLRIGTAQEKPDPITLYPADNQFDGWVLKDSVRTYVPNDLYLQVGEVAGLYTEFGIRKSLEGIYANEKAERIILEVFEMNDPKGAWGIFTMNSSAKGQNISLGDTATKYDYYLHFVKANYYFHCTTSNKSPESFQVLTAMASSMAEQITGHAKKPYIMLAFQFDNMDVTRERYFKGQIGLNEVFDFGHGSIASFDEGAGCRFEDKMFFVLAYSDERKRREWFASARGKFKMSQNQRFTDYKMMEDGFTAKDKNGSLFAFKPYGKFILITGGYTWNEGGEIFKKMEANLDHAAH